MGHQKTCRLNQQVSTRRGQFYGLVAASKQLLPDLFLQLLYLRRHRRRAAMDIVGGILEAAQPGYCLEGSEYVDVEAFPH
ncbi:hypothetical protein D3C80_1084590 [compost metagenome]